MSKEDELDLLDFLPDSGIYDEYMEGYLTDKYYEYVLKGGRGGVKSSISGLSAVLNVLQRKGNSMCIRRYKNTLRGSVYAEVGKAMARIGVDSEFESKVSPLEYVHKVSGLKITFAGLDDGTKLKSSTLSKGNYTTVVYEECQEMVKSEIDTVNRTLARGKSHCNLLYCYNPPSNPNHWVNNDLGMDNDTDKYILHVGWEDIPKEWLGSQFVKMALKLKEKDPIAYRNIYGGEVIGGVGAVFNNVYQLKEGAEFNKAYVSRGVDFGWSPDPIVYNCWAYDKKTNSIYCMYEYEGNNVKLKDFAKIIKSENKHNFTVYCDNAEPRSIDTLVENGVYGATACRKGTDSIRHGIKWLQDLDGIYIDPIKCPKTYAEFVGFMYGTDKYGNQLDTFEGADHHIDATRYALQDYIL